MEAPGVAYIDVIVGAAAYVATAGDAATIEVIVGTPVDMIGNFR